MERGLDMQRRMGEGRAIRGAWEGRLRGDNGGKGNYYSNSARTSSAISKSGLSCRSEANDFIFWSEN